YYLRLATALEGEDRVDDAVISVPGDGIVRSNFGKDIKLDLSDEDKERAQGHFPLRLLFEPFGAMTWLSQLSNTGVMNQVVAHLLTPVGSYAIPAIVLDDST